MPDSLTMTTPDGVDIAVFRWLPAVGTPRAVVQIAHGAAEHARRYGRLAGELTGAGYAVYANDHRAHGETAAADRGPGLAGPDAWNHVVTDAKQLTDLIAAEQPGLPIVLLGHSMGSLLAQDYLPRFGDGLAAAVLSGTTGSSPLEDDELKAQILAAAVEQGPDEPSEQFGLLFADFNDPFVEGAGPDGPTGFEWLSRDADEVKLYVDDPWCGFLLSNGFVAAMTEGLDAMWAEGYERTIPIALPVLIICGDQDPVGQNGEAVHTLTDRYRNVGLEVTEILYPGARHEIFNETNRDEVHRDLLTWLDRVLPDPVVQPG